MYVYRLAHALGDAGHQVDVVHCVDSYHLLHREEPEIRYAEHPNVRRHGLRSRFGWLSPLLTHQTGQPFMKMEAIGRIIEERVPDVIHFHNVSLLGPGILALDGGSPDVIKMYTTHEHWLICPTHVLWKFNRRPCEKPQCLPCTLLAARPPQYWRYTGLLNEASRHVDQFVSPSRFTARMHRERGFPRPVEHLPYFIERADSDWQNPGPRPQNRPYFLFVGRLERIKGLQTLIDIWKEIPDADLLCAGSGGYQSELRALAASNPRIRFLGPLSQRELGALYFHAHALIVPSLTYETFGIILIESFARKSPVIVRDLGALPEIVEDSGGGFVFGTEAELLQAIRRLTDSPQLRSELGEKGYAAFLRRWCKDPHLEMYFEFLRRIAREKLGRIPWEES